MAKQHDLLWVNTQCTNIQIGCNHFVKPMFISNFGFKMLHVQQNVTCWRYAGKCNRRLTANRKCQYDVCENRPKTQQITKKTRTGRQTLQCGKWIYWTDCTKCHLLLRFLSCGFFRRSSAEKIGEHKTGDRVTE